MALRRILAGVVGVLLGGLGSLSLALLSEVGGWVLVVPPLAGAVVGAVWGDRGVKLLGRAVEWL